MPRSARTRGLLLAAALLGLAPLVAAAPNGAEPHLGYAYPAGGRQGTTFHIVVGGQRLGGAERVYVSGGGVRAAVVGLEPRRLKPEQMQALGDRLRELTQARQSELRQALVPGSTPAPGKKGEKPGEKKEVAPPLPDHPFLRKLDRLDLRELRKVREFFFDPTRALQAAPSIAETLEIAVTISADAAPGDRELRVATRAGLTNPVTFQVGTLPELLEDEVNDFRPMVLPERGPFVLNGQVLAHDVDRFRLRARAGQKLAFLVAARRLVPYLADAVPGWFQAAITLRDAKGREVAFADHYRFDPDPVLFYEVKAAGDYELEVRDALYRGRSDFVYRITIGEVPFVARLFPLGGPLGATVTAQVGGFALARNAIALDTRAPGRHRLAGVAGPFGYDVGDLPECVERERNDDWASAEAVRLPIVVNGRIDRPGDVDLFRFDGRAGEEVVAEVVARRLGSPLDSRLEVLDAAARVLAENDDFEDPEAGLVTHQADSYVRVRLPASGPVTVRITDAQGRGGEEYAYRLRIGAPRPDFSLIVSPSSLNVPAGAPATFTVRAVRKDGFDGDIEVALRDAPAGFALSGNLIPAGRESIRMTLRAPPRPGGAPVALALEGRARIGAETVTRRAVPADDMMQAFLYRHLVPAQEWLVEVTRSRPGLPGVEIDGAAPIRLVCGAAAEVRFRAPRLPPLDRTRFDLGEAAGGVTLTAARAVRGGFALSLRAEGAKAGARENLIVEVYEDVEVGRPAKEPASPKAPATPQGRGTVPPPRASRRVFRGVLPAIPILVEPAAPY